MAAPAATDRRDVARTLTAAPSVCCGQSTVGDHVAYAATEVLHDPGYTPPGPAVTLDPPQVDSNFRGGGLVLTTFYHDDTDPVPGVPTATLSAPGVPGEHARWPLPLSPEQTGAYELRDKAAKRLATLNAIAKGTSGLTNAQIAQELAQNQRRLIMLATGDTATPE